MRLVFMAVGWSTTWLWLGLCLLPPETASTADLDHPDPDRRLTRISNRSPHFVDYYWIEPARGEAILSSSRPIPPKGREELVTYVNHTFEVRQVAAADKGTACDSPDADGACRIRRFSITEKFHEHWFVLGEDMVVDSSLDSPLQRSRRFVCKNPDNADGGLLPLPGAGTAPRGTEDACSEDGVAWPFTPFHSSPVVRRLTPGLYSELSGRATERGGYTIDDLILRGVEEEVVGVGIVAADAESYDVFPEIFWPVLLDFSEYFGDIGTGVGGTSGGGKDSCGPNDGTPLAVDGQRILSFRIRAARNLKGRDFIPYMTGRERCAVSDAIRPAMEDLPELLKRSGTAVEDSRWYDPYEISAAELDLLVRQHLWRSAPSKPQLLFGYNGNPLSWPLGRALWLGRNQYEESDGSRPSWLSVWINEEDHLRVVALESTRGRRLDGVLKRWQSLMTATQQALEKRGHSFAHHEDFGFLSTCPTNVGTGMRISVRLYLPSLSPDAVDSIARNYHLEVRSNEELLAVGGTNKRVLVHQVSNKQRWGVSEEEIYAVVTRGVRELLAADEPFSTFPLLLGL